MRLTLRTLLAYLDKILDKSDAHELEGKIRESELASQLIQRIQRVLAARRSTASEAGLKPVTSDANLIAEYLDNTLPPEQVAETERVCLESDSQLAEVAACHQILTIVLGERAEVPIALKQRIYQLDPKRLAVQRATPIVPPSATPSRWTVGSSPDRSVRLDGPPPATNQAPRVASSESLGARRPVTAVVAANTQTRGPGAVNAAAAIDEDERWTSAPEYLTRPRRNWTRSLAIGAAITILLALAALRGMGSFDRQHPLFQRWIASTDSTASVAPTTNNAGAADELDRAPTIADNTNATDAAGINAVRANEVPAPNHASNATLPGTDDAEDVDTEAAVESNTRQQSTDEGSAQAVVGSEPDNDLANDRNAEAATADSSSVPALIDTEESQEAMSAVGSSPAESRDDATGDNGARLGDNSVSASEESVPPTNDNSAPNASASASTSEDDLTPETDASEEATDAQTAQEATEEEATALINPLDPNSGRPAVTPDLAHADRRTNPPLVTDEGALGAASGDADRPGAATPPQPGPPTWAAFLDERQLLLHWKTDENAWKRMGPGQRLQAGDRLMALPTFRPPVVLASGMQVNLIGATHLEVLPTDSEKTPHLALDYGRVAISAFTSAGTSLVIHWGEKQTAAVRLSGTTATLAIEVSRRYLPGENMAEATPHTLVFAYVTSGSAEWATEGQEPIELPAGQRLVVVDTRAAQLGEAKQLPAWIQGTDARPIDPKAGQEMMEKLRLDRPEALTLQLQELAQDRHLEVRSLAACSLAYLGDFDPLVNSMTDVKLKAYWPAQYETLMHIGALGPEVGRQLQESYQRRHGEADGGALFRLVCGYAPPQLQSGSDKLLIDYLDHASTDFRFIANETLKTITGLPTLYQAHLNDRQRRTAVAKWRKYQQTGKIVYEHPPELAALLVDEGWSPPAAKSTTRETPQEPRR